MRELLSIVLIVIISPLFGQTNIETIELNWKIAPNEKITYLTEMSDMDSLAEFKMDGFMKLLPDSSGKDFKEGQNLFKKLNKSLKNTDFLTTLSQKQKGVIDIVMVTRPKNVETIPIDSSDKKASEFLKLMEGMSKGVMLRGSVYETGRIHSFWIKSNQKNLVATLFELPEGKLKLGDSWGLEIDLIANDQNFVCDSAYKKNEVTLTDIKEVNGERVAVLKYDIVEYVDGNFNMPGVLGGESTPTMLYFTHQAVAEFLIDKGRWKTYTGVMSFEATGFMTAHKKTKFSLIEE